MGSSTPPRDDDVQVPVASAFNALRGSPPPHAAHADDQAKPALAVADAHAYERAVIELQAIWHQRLGKIRRGSATDLLLMWLPGAPIVTVQSAAARIGRSTQATNEVVSRLTAAGILSQTTVGRRNRAFEAVELID